RVLIRIKFKCLEFKVLLTSTPEHQIDQTVTRQAPTVLIGSRNTESTL
ncbi:MAG: hypothetical protein ACI9XK_002287, partial [Granulosicoccus sp.]